ncbi:MAG: diadenylate cyclase CdaA [Chloroflexi bacterium]|nr:diadenylate cyclase CdaA [Chloroflexota bacterium]
MSGLVESITSQVRLTTLLDIAITAFVIYWLFNLIRGTRAVRLVIGVSVLLVVYALAQLLGFRLLTQLMQAGAVVGLFALVVIFQPELRRALDRLGRVGSLAWLVSPADGRPAERAAAAVARAAARLSAAGAGALIVLERETGLEEIAETGVMMHAELSTDLLESLFAPRGALHDGAVIVRGDTILAAGALLPLAETTLQAERFGTRHRAALGITEQTDALVVVVSEETGGMSLVERARIRRGLDEAHLARLLAELLAPAAEGSTGLRARPGSLRRAALADLRRVVRSGPGGSGSRAAPQTGPTPPANAPDEPPPARAGAGR